MAEEVEQTPLIPVEDGEYWVCIAGPVDLPKDRRFIESHPRVAARNAIKELVADGDEELFDIVDFNVWSSWGVTKEKIKDINTAWFSERGIPACPELDRLRDENDKLNRIIGLILMKTGPIEVDTMDIREFNRNPGFLEEQKDGNFYKYQWIKSSR